MTLATITTTICSISQVKSIIYRKIKWDHWQSTAPNSQIIIRPKKKILRRSWSATLIIFKNENEVGNEKVIFKNTIGRLRDIKIDQKGKIYLLSNGDDALWVMKKNN